nr:MAG TPA: hypothetical protein [Caudoviricetes sp.]
MIHTMWYQLRSTKRSRCDLNNSKEHIFESHIAQANNVKSNFSG